VTVIASDPAFARCASYGGFEVRRSAEREGGSEAIHSDTQGCCRLDCFVAFGSSQ